MRLVYIEWLDSHHTAGWRSDEAATEPVVVRSVGWLVHDGANAKTIAPHMTNETPSQRCGEMTIPSITIVRLKELRTGSGDNAEAAIERGGEVRACQH